MKIIKIGAIWCPGCLVMGKIWNKIIKDYNDLEIIELDYDMNREEVSEYNTGNILPVYIFMSNTGSELERLVGEQKELVLRDTIDKYRGI